MSVFRMYGSGIEWDNDILLKLKYQKYHFVYNNHVSCSIPDVKVIQSSILLHVMLLLIVLFFPMETNKTHKLNNICRGKKI